jgi:hypothetical protein
MSYPEPCELPLNLAANRNLGLLIDLRIQTGLWYLPMYVLSQHFSCVDEFWQVPASSGMSQDDESLHQAIAASLSQTIDPTDVYEEPTLEERLRTDNRCVHEWL